MAEAQAPYQNVPLYHVLPTPWPAPVQWTRSFYRPSPAANAAPAGTVRVNWRQAIDAAYIGQHPAGRHHLHAWHGPSATSAGTGLAAEYVPGRGKELLPIPQSTACPPTRP